MIKKITAFCLILSLCFTIIGTMPVFAAAKQKAEIQLLNDLGIIDSSDETGLIPKGYTRGDFAKSLHKMMNVEPLLSMVEENAVLAADIENNKNYDYIVSAIYLGYMEIDSDNKFRPSDAITQTDALKAIIKALGYNEVVLHQGGREQDYLAWGMKLDILDSVKIGNPDKLTSKEVAQMLANAMSVRFFSTDGIDMGDECFFSQWGLNACYGRIYANSKFGFVVEKAPYMHVNIDGEKYYTKIQIKDEFVGCYVKYYTRHTDMGEEVVSVSDILYGGEENVTIKAGEVEGISDTGRNIVVTYDKKDKVSIAKSAHMIVNGKTVNPTKAVFDAFKSGTMTFVDADHNGTFDIVNMTLLNQDIIGGIDSRNEAVILKYGNQKIVLKDLDVYEIYLNGKVAKLSDLTEDMAVGVACDSFIVSSGKVTYNFAKAKLVTLYASSKKASGFVDSLIDEETIEIDGIERTLGSSYQSLVNSKVIQKIELGDYVTLYLDTFGEVVTYEFDSSKSGLQYGYLIRAAAYKKGIKSELGMRIMNSGGIIDTYYTNDKFILDNKKVEIGATTSYNFGGTEVDLTKRQVIRFRADGNVIKEIDTQNVCVSNGETKENSLSNDLDFDAYGTGAAKREIVRDVADNKFALKSDVVIFMDEAPLDDENPDEFYFSVTTASALDEEYMGGYDADNDNMISALCVWSAYGVSSSEGEVSIKIPALPGDVHDMVVEKVVNAFDKNREEGYRISLAGASAKGSYFVRSGVYKYYEVQSDSDWEKTSTSNYENPYVHFVKDADLYAKLKPGDVIRIKTNAANEITYIEKLFDFNTYKGGYKDVPHSKGGTSYGFVQLDKVIDKFFLYTSGGEQYMTAKSPFVSLIPTYFVNDEEVVMLPMNEIPSQAKGSTVKIYVRMYDHARMRGTVAYVFD